MDGINKILNKSENIFNEERNEEAFRIEVKRVLNDNIFSDEDRIFLENLSVKFNISMPEGIIENEKEKIYADVLQNLSSDGIITLSEKKELETLRKNLGLPEKNTIIIEQDYKLFKEKEKKNEPVFLSDLHDLHKSDYIDDGALKWTGIDYSMTEYFEVKNHYFEKSGDYLAGSWLLAVDKSFKDMISDYGSEYWIDKAKNAKELYVFDNEFSLDNYICDKLGLLSYEECENRYTSSLSPELLKSYLEKERKEGWAIDSELTGLLTESLYDMIYEDDSHLVEVFTPLFNPEKNISLLNLRQSKIDYDSFGQEYSYQDLAFDLYLYNSEHPEENNEIKNYILEKLTTAANLGPLKNLDFNNELNGEMYFYAFQKLQDFYDAPEEKRLKNNGELNLLLQAYSESEKKDIMFSYFKNNFFVKEGPDKIQEIYSKNELIEKALIFAKKNLNMLSPEAKKLFERLSPEKNIFITESRETKVPERYIESVRKFLTETKKVSDENLKEILSENFKILKPSEQKAVIKYFEKAGLNVSMSSDKLISLFKKETERKPERKKSRKKEISYSRS